MDQNQYAQLLAGLLQAPSVSGMSGAVGLDEIIGNIGLDEIIGADSPGSKARELAQLAQIRAAGGVGVQNVKRDRMRIQPAAFAATAVVASGQGTITIQPQRLIQVHSLMIPSFLNGLFDVADIRVGQQTQYITSGVVPSVCWSEVADGKRSAVKFDSADIGNLVTLVVNNLDTVNAQTFRAAVFAVAVF